MKVKNLPVRKQNRLKNYDYSQDGAYFITICTKDRECMLGEVVGKGAVGNAVVGDAVVGDAVHSVPSYAVLSDYGKIAENILEHGGNPQTLLDKYVIMPNHVHMILVVRRDAVDSVPYNSVPYKGVAYKSLISTFVRSFKTMMTKQVGFPVWQRSFHDHIIRDEQDYLRIAEYIQNNPALWQDDCFYPK